MRALSASELLEVWESGLAQPSVERALALFAAAHPETPVAALAELSIGERDECLLTLRERLFGPRLAGIASCPACAERLDLDLSVADIRAPSDQRTSAPLALKAGEYEISFRLPSTADQFALPESAGVSEARKLLLERCLLQVLRGNQPIPASELPEYICAAVEEQMSRSDPQADVQLALCCPACRHHWHLAFDITSFFWSEIHNWARRVLSEVHALSRAYGWREKDILSMSPQRRQLYMEMVSE